MYERNASDFGGNSTVSSPIFPPDVPPEYMQETFQAIASVASRVIVVTTILGLIGNSLTVLVFAKLGFSETIHMSYVALAVSDFGCVLTLLWSRMCYSPLLKSIFLRYRLDYDTTLFANFTGAWPNHGFSRTTALLTAWISLERCLCVLFPTKVKVMITRKVTKVVLTTVYVIGVCPVALAFVGVTSEMTFEPERNLTTLIIGYDAGGKQQNLNALNQIAFVLYGALYPLASWATVTVCTAFLITALKRSARWRRQNAGAAYTSSGSGSCAGYARDGNKSGSGNKVTTGAEKRNDKTTAGAELSTSKSTTGTQSSNVSTTESKEETETGSNNKTGTGSAKQRNRGYTGYNKKLPSRDTRVTRTVVAIACAFIVFSLPISATVVTAFFIREFSVNGLLHFPLMICVALSLTFSGLNSSINIAVYTATGSKFRETLLQLFKVKPRKAQY